MVVEDPNCLRPSMHIKLNDTLTNEANKRYSC